MSGRTPLARVEGFGAAHSGTRHFWFQRVTAVALVPLSIWFAFAALRLVGADRGAAVAFLKMPLDGVLMALFVVAALVHMALGIQVVIEDYVHTDGRKIAFLLCNQFLAWIIGAACLFALVRIAL